MKNIGFLALIAIFLFSACNSKPTPSGTSDLANLEKTTTTPFTDTVKLDTFKVTLQGKTSKESALIFKIISYQGEEIYNASIKASELIKENAKLKTESDKMNFLKNEVQYFFEEEHFLWPAVMPNEQADKNVPDKDFHNELKQTQLNGFNYRLGKEAKVYIAWSVKEQKVKVYYRL